MTLAEIIRIADDIAPPRLAVERDPIGLHAGDPAQAVSKVAVCLDLTMRVLHEVQRLGAQAVLTHHPVVYTPITSVAETSPQGRLLAEAVRSRIAVYALHTNWDAAPDGMNDALVSALGICNTSALDPSPAGEFCKIVVFVPDEAAQAVRMALGDAGAGALGNYTHCSFRSRGTGSFLPVEGASPHIGEVNRLEDVDEWRIEALVPRRLAAAAIAAMLREHPYEEPAFDVYPVETPQASASGAVCGIGRIGDLSEPVTFAGLQKRVLSVLGDLPLRCVGDAGRMVKKVAVCGGAGGDLVQRAASLGADVYITGDVRRHEFVLAEGLGLAVIDATHDAPETFGMKHFAKRFAAKLPPGIEIVFVE